jgi:hypothetical protein
MSLPYGAEVLLGGTVNLGNYENIRFELRGQVRDGDDLDALITGFGETARRFGRGDPATAAAVDSWVSRVIPSTSVEVSPEPVPAAQSTPVEPVREAHAAPVPAKKDMHPASPPVATNTPLQVPSSPAPVQPAEIGAGFACEQCGKQITSSERTTSQLFCNKSVCKGCLQSMNKAVVGDRV